MDRLIDKGTLFTYEQMSQTARAKFRALADCLGRILPNNPVIITGLTSEAGIQLNGLSGIARDFDGQRWAVILPQLGGKKIKPGNLKTPGGILRTNSFQEASPDGCVTEVMFEYICRINHSCVPNEQMYRRGDWDPAVTLCCLHCATFARESSSSSTTASQRVICKPEGVG